MLVAGNAASAGRRSVLLCFRRFGAVRYGGAFCAAGSSRRICLWPFSIGHIALVDSRDRLRRVGIGSPTGLTGARRYSVDRPSRTTRACMVCCRRGSLGRGQHCLSGGARGAALGGCVVTGGFSNYALIEKSAGREESGGKV